MADLFGIDKAPEPVSADGAAALALTRAILSHAPLTAGPYSPAFKRQHRRMLVQLRKARRLVEDALAGVL